MRGLRPGLTFSKSRPEELAPYAASVAVTMRDADGDVGWAGSCCSMTRGNGAGAGRSVIGHIASTSSPRSRRIRWSRVGWSWLTEALDARAVGYEQTSGTVTRW